MPNKKIKILLALSLITWIAPFPVEAQSYGTLAVKSPSGTSSGWIFPQDKPSSLGQAVFVVSSPVKERNSTSAVWFLDADKLSMSFSARENYQERIGATWADINGDNSQDVIIYFKDRPQARIIIANKQSGGQPRIAEISLPILSPKSLGACDLNADGQAELLAMNLTSITILWQTGKDSLQNPVFAHVDTLKTMLPSTWHPLASNDFLFGDFNGDGRMDFIVVGFLYLNQGSNKFSPLEMPVLTRTISGPVLGADIDHDRKTEILYAKPAVATGTKDIIVAAGYDQQSVFKEKTSFSPPFSRIDSYIAGDFTGDSYPDLCLFSKAGSTLIILRSSSSSLFSVKPDTIFTEPYNQVSGEFLGPIDWRRDGKLDWLFLDSQKDTLFVKYFRNNSYQDKTSELGLDKRMTGYAAAVGDYNNDGYPEIYVVNGSGPNALFLRQPDGRFRDVAQEAGVAQGNDGVSCAWGDYDNDGFADLYVAGLYFPDKLFHNNGDGTFADSSRILPTSHKDQRATSISWGDVNRDGWLDLVIGNYDGPNILLLNRSGRSFENRSREMGLIDADKTESAVFVDVNGDGWLDIFSLNAEGPNRLLTGSSIGVFLDSTATSGLNPGQEYKKFGQTQNWADFNGDGLPDLYITRAQDTDMLFRNKSPREIISERFTLILPENLQGDYGRIANAIADFSGDGWPDLLISRSSVFGDFSSIAATLFFPGRMGDFPSFVEKDNLADNLGLKLNLDTNLPVPGDFDLDRDLDLLFVNYLVDNPLDFFHGSPLSLHYLQNQNTYCRTLLVKLRRPRKKSAIGARVLCAYAGKTYLQTVSGGFGRIQTGPDLLFSLGETAFADSLVVYWPQGNRQKQTGPLYPGTIEFIEDSQGPVLIPLELPPERPVPLTSAADSLAASIEVSDESPLAWLKTVIIHSQPARTDTLFYSIDAPGVLRLKLPFPAPGDSISYYFESADIYGNKTRLLANQGQFYTLKIKFVPGDINGDMVIDIYDFLRLMQLISGQGNPPSAYEFSAGDLNGDGRLDTSDLVALLNKINSR